MKLFAALGATLVAAAVLGVLGWGLAHPPAAPVARIGSAAPSVTFELLDGGSVSLAAYRGRPVVVNFWATWCADCKKEAPALAAAAGTRPDVAFLGLLYQDSLSAARAYASVAGPYAYPIGYSEDAGTAFGVQSNPETYFLDARGVVRAIAIGPMTQGQLATDLGMVSA
ncbi:MAG TPA: redoxin domain-containing protein [Candidatus Dormibacteraeota bacterium]